MSSRKFDDVDMEGPEPIETYDLGPGIRRGERVKWIVLQTLADFPLGGLQSFRANNFCAKYSFVGA